MKPDIELILGGMLLAVLAVWILCVYLTERMRRKRMGKIFNRHRRRR